MNKKMRLERFLNRNDIDHNSPHEGIYIKLTDRGREEIRVNMKPKFYRGCQCPICGRGKLYKKVKDMVFTVKGYKVLVPNYVTYECNLCKYGAFPTDAMEKKLIACARKQVGWVCPECNNDNPGSKNKKRCRKCGYLRKTDKICEFKPQHMSKIGL